MAFFEATKPLTSTADLGNYLNSTSDVNSDTSSPLSLSEKRAEAWFQLRVESPSTVFSHQTVLVHTLYFSESKVDCLHMQFMDTFVMVQSQFNLNH